MKSVEHSTKPAAIFVASDGVGPRLRPARRAAEGAAPGATLDAFLGAASLLPLLSADEEAGLGRAAEAGRAARGRLEDQGEGLDPWEREGLERQSAAGSRAEAELVARNLRLAASVARGYVGLGLDLADLVQEASLGLMRAAQLYDWRRGCRFSTYAVPWCRQAVTRALADKSRAIRLPANVSGLVDRLRRAERDAEARGGAASDAELASVLGVGEGRVAQLRAWGRPCASLDGSLRDDEEGEATLGDLIEDPSPDDPEEAAVRMSVSRELASALAELDARQRDVLSLRFGLDGGGRRTLEETGRSLGVSRERARQIEVKALEALRSSPRVLALREASA